ncbi:hypothetical protein DXN05_16835 [Deminuibacter soli]|uniref:Uncharacterized protein n=1 Tax=Deminuibacter soli TaxID=2291815 RepID=A0A3E1NH56_9BACT|nr:hypothetical protein DXN05_16835 [Deminuibacter soli]
MYYAAPFPYCTYSYSNKKAPDKRRGQRKCFHNGIILIVICFFAKVIKLMKTRKSFFTNKLKSGLGDELTNN